MPEADGLAVTIEAPPGVISFDPAEIPFQQSFPFQLSYTPVEDQPSYKEGIQINLVCNSVECCADVGGKYCSDAKYCIGSYRKCEQLIVDCGEPGAVKYCEGSFPGGAEFQIGCRDNMPVCCGTYEQFCATGPVICGDALACVTNGQSFDCSSGTCI